MEGEQPGELDSNLREGKMGLERGLPVTLKCSLSAFLTIYLTLPSHINIHADARNHVTQVNTCCKLLFHYFPGQLEVALKKMRLQFNCLGAGIRTLSDSVLSSGRLKMTHNLSLELGSHKHISIPLNSAPSLKSSDNLLPIRSCVMFLVN